MTAICVDGAGRDADAVRSALAALYSNSGEQAVVVLADIAGVEDAISRVRAARGASMAILLLSRESDPLLAGALNGLLDPLAVDCAPAMRIGLVEPASDADLEDVAAAIVYLAHADCTTGQRIAISGRSAPVN